MASVVKAIPVKVRKTNWRSIVQNADPEHPKNSRINDEYVFSGNDPKGQGPRVFTGDYTKRGPYGS